ncbi:hypothetical protein DHW03_07215 [Pedobacter yonginense]|uniref:Phosphatidylcholine 1-acylhydrolase n=1 Tax=Pedobacter yonginense TaxID=651869 RepID=A0A317EML3_9SPHI|nr:hypothetical protein [Pedobacter yonginense]PWS27397.1 hypothetical protein DHW03_07215 [Pedobacter yonginense]
MKKSLLFLVVTVLTLPVLAQNNLDSVVTKRAFANKEYINLYKENSDLSYTAPAGEIGAPTKYVINGRLTTTYMLLGTYKSPVAFSIIPDFTVRVRNEFSAGVRTPSYRLGGVLYARLNANPENYKYAELAFTHHSNGQDQAAINPDGSVNTISGNFNANYLTASYRFGHLTAFNANGSYYSFNQRIGLQWFKFFRYEPALDLGFGFTRVLYNFSWRKYDEVEKNARNKPKVKTEKETWRLNTELSYAVNQIPSKNIVNIGKRLNAEVNFNYSLPFMNNVFLMAAVGYYGEDNYNIYFQDHYGYMRFGLSSGFLRNRSRHYDN